MGTLGQAANAEGVQGLDHLISTAVKRAGKIAAQKQKAAQDWPKGKRPIETPTFVQGCPIEPPPLPPGAQNFGQLDKVCQVNGLGVADITLTPELVKQATMPLAVVADGACVEGGYATYSTAKKAFFKNVMRL